MLVSAGVRAQAQLPPLQNLPAENPDPILPLPRPVPVPGAEALLPVEGPVRQLTIRPRSAQDLQARNFAMPNGETAVVVTSGVVLTVAIQGERKALLDIEADRLVFWTKGQGNDLFNSLKSPQGQSTRSMEFYLAGNVEIRTQTARETEVLRADEVYYDVGRSVAIALQADLEIKEPRLPYPIHVRSDEILQLNAKVFEISKSVISSTILPSDPGLTVEVRQLRIEERERRPTDIFGRPWVNPATGQPRVEKDRIFTGTNMLTRLERVPIFYFPYLRGRVEDPLGPLQSLSYGYSQKIFGFQIFSTWDVFDLLGAERPPHTQWRLFADYMTLRGPALGTAYEFSAPELFGAPGKVDGLFKAWGIHDNGDDILGGNRGRVTLVTPTEAIPITHPDWRGRVLSRINAQELPQGFVFQGQLSLLSDQNFLEQYYQREFLNELNQETFLYVKQQQDNWAWTALGEVRLRDWITETNWLPRLDGHLIGENLGDLFVYNARAHAGYAQLKPTNVAPFAYQPTDVRVDAGRFDLWQDLSMPWQLGAFKVVPYVVGDAAYYTQDVNGDQQGRLYGAAGLRASLPLSRLYPDIESDLLNLNGIYHKMMFSANYYYARSSTSLYELPQFDRLNDDTSDYTLRAIRPYQPSLNPSNANNLITNPLFDYQLFALRRLVDNRIDTLDDMNVVQLGWRQRWQTKRGFPGHEHVIDWMTLDLGVSLFPDPNRDNFGNTAGILEYDWMWNLGDRTALSSYGWMEPVSGGPRLFNFGTILNRPDGTNFYLGYRMIDPLQSRAIIATVNYPFSQKYTLTGSTVWDFGVDQQTYALQLTRTGTDTAVSFGVGYNSVLKTFGVTFQIVPTLLRGQLAQNAAGMPLTSNAVSNSGSGSAR